MKPVKSALLLTTILIATLLWIPLTIAAPNEMNFQGRLTDATGNPVADGTYRIEFLFYDADVGGSLIWGEFQDVLVTDGLYNVTIGHGAQYTPEPFDEVVFSEDDRWLQVFVNGEELTPRQKITSVAYAFQAGSTVAGAVTSVMLADDAVTEAKVQDGSITAIKISGGPDSGLDSDTLDGYQAADFAPAAHNHNTQYYTKTEVDNLINGYESRIAALEDILAKFSVSDDGKQIYITEANLHVRSGSGATDGTVNGLGNVIIGYNEERSEGNDRTGSHNIVVGRNQNYSSYGGLVAGFFNTTSAPYASVSGGISNTASGNYASVSGGENNTASGWWSSVSGGFTNNANGGHTSVTGGSDNTAIGQYASVTGGRNNQASGDYSSVVGGGNDDPYIGNHAYANYSSILGGLGNLTGSNDPDTDPQHTVGELSTISGGGFNEASGYSASVSGGISNTASGNYASVSGGGSNTASGGFSSVSGGKNNTASGRYSAVVGGGSDDPANGNVAWANYSSILGGIKNTTGNSSDNTVGERATISGGDTNIATGTSSTVSGGVGNTAEAMRSTVSGGAGLTETAYQGYASPNSP